MTDLIKLFSREGRKFYFFLVRTAGYWPRNTDHFRKAFVHRSVRSASGKRNGDSNNERLEFLGDAIIEAVVSDILYHRFPNADEGFMSQLRSNMVCRARLNDVSFSLGLERYIVLSSRRDLGVSHIPGDVLEAFVAAIYLDGGMRRACRFVARHIACAKRIEMALADSQKTNYKSELVSVGEQEGLEVFFETHRLSEKLIASDGSEVNFFSDIRILGKNVGHGCGRSKKQAEQAAAQQVVEALHKSLLSLALFVERADKECVAAEPVSPIIIPDSFPQISWTQSNAEAAYPYNKCQ